MRANKQLAGCLAETNYSMTPRLHKLLTKHSQVNVQTQIIEDANGIQKVSSSMKKCRKFRKPASSMAAVLEKDSVSVPGVACIDSKH